MHCEVKLNFENYDYYPSIMPNTFGCLLCVCQHNRPDPTNIVQLNICDWIYGNRSKSHIGSYEIIDFKAP